MKQKFRDIKLSKANKIRLDEINDIIEEYKKGGYKLTLRQLYYQLVSRDIIPNIQSEYSKLSKVLKEGRMAGVIDWEAIEDRLRVPYSPAEFDSPEQILDVCINQYRLPRMVNQPVYVEVWVEKDALSGVLKRVTSKYGIPILVNRGYSSVTAMKDAFDRFHEYLDRGQQCWVLYLGDHDPSGQDMIRDITDRIKEFIFGYYKEWYDADTAISACGLFFVNAIALTKKQILKYKPPPNPAKTTDTRAAKYIEEHGGESWEVDALKPDILHKILEDAITDLIDVNLFNEKVRAETKDKDILRSLKKHL